MRVESVPVQSDSMAYQMPAIENVANTTEKTNLKLIKKHRPAVRFSTVIWIMLIFVAFFIIISRYSTMTNMNYEIAELKNQLNSLNSGNSALEVELDRMTNLMMIRYSASTELGMKEADKQQIVYISVPRANKVTFENSGKEEETIGIFNNLKAMISGFTN